MGPGLLAPGQGHSRRQPPARPLQRGNCTRMLQPHCMSSCERISGPQAARCNRSRGYGNCRCFLFVCACGRPGSVVSSRGADVRRARGGEAHEWPSSWAKPMPGSKPGRLQQLGRFRQLQQMRVFWGLAALGQQASMLVQLGTASMARGAGPRQILGACWRHSVAAVMLCLLSSYADDGMELCGQRDAQCMRFGAPGTAHTPLRSRRGGWARPSTRSPCWGSGRDHGVW